MTSEVEVKCINKSDRQNPHERILNIGGINPNGTRWKVSQTDAITFIEKGEFSFYVAGKTLLAPRARVIVAVSQYGHKYIKTENDGVQPNNLLSLPECP